MKEEKSAIFESRLADAEARKVAGNQLFKDQQWAAALQLYKQGLHHCEFDEMQFNFELLDEHRDQVIQIRVPLYLNASACAQKLQDFESSAEFCSEAMLLQPDNAKTLFRRGVSYFQLRNYEKSKIDLSQAAKLQPQDKLVRKALVDLMGAMRQEELAAKKTWAGVFENHEEIAAPKSFCDRILSWISSYYNGHQKDE